MEEHNGGTFEMLPTGQRTFEKQKNLSALEVPESECLLRLSLRLYSQAVARLVQAAPGELGGVW